MIYLRDDLVAQHAMGSGEVGPERLSQLLALFSQDSLSESGKRSRIPFSSYHLLAKLPGHVDTNLIPDTPYTLARISEHGHPNPL